MIDQIGTTLKGKRAAAARGEEREGARAGAGRPQDRGQAPGTQVRS